MTAPRRWLAALPSLPRLVRSLPLLLAALPLVTLCGCGHLVVLHDPLSAPEHNDLGLAYESKGQLDLAEKQYRQAIRLDRSLTVARVNLGNVEAARGRWPQAEREYRRALERNPGDADAMNNLAAVLLRRGGRRAEAITWAERAVARGGARDSIYRATLTEVMAAPPSK